MDFIVSLNIFTNLFVQSGTFVLGKHISIPQYFLWYFCISVLGKINYPEIIVDPVKIYRCEIHSRNRRGCRSPKTILRSGNRPEPVISCRPSIPFPATCRRRSVSSPPRPCREVRPHASQGRSRAPLPDRKVRFAPSAASRRRAGNSPARCPPRPGRPPSRTKAGPVP